MRAEAVDGKGPWRRLRSSVGHHRHADVSRGIIRDLALQTPANLVWFSAQPGFNSGGKRWLTQAHNPQGNGMSQASVRAFKRNYVQVSSAAGRSDGAGIDRESL
jgi:hypothetical protein